MTGAPDIIVVGGGIIGLWTAVLAARGGYKVTVLEAQTIGRHASSASAGGVRSLNRDPAEVPLARAALPLWERAAADLGADVGFKASGQIRIAETEEALGKLEARAALTRSLGYEHEVLLGANALRALEPAIGPGIKGGLIVADDGFADPLRTIHALRKAAVAAGVRLLEGVAVRGLEGSDPIAVHTEDGVMCAPTVVNAAGAWGARVAEAAGESVPLEPHALQMSVTAPLPVFVKAVIGIEGHKLSLKQSEAGHVIMGGGFFGAIDHDRRIGRPRLERVAQNLQNAMRVFPHLATAQVVRTWAGIEGITPDGVPVVSESGSVPGLVHAFGFCGHGFALAPLIGRLVLGIIEDHDAEVPLAPFSIHRFGAGIRERHRA